MINETNDKMENKMVFIEVKVTHTFEKITQRIGGVEKTVQNLQRKVYVARKVTELKNTCQPK